MSIAITIIPREMNRLAITNNHANPLIALASMPVNTSAAGLIMILNSKLCEIIDSRKNKIESIQTIVAAKFKTLNEAKIFVPTGIDFLFI